MGQWYNKKGENMKLRWIVVWSDNEDPQFNKCSIRMSKKRAKETFEVMQGRYLVKIKKQRSF